MKKIILMVIAMVMTVGIAESIAAPKAPKAPKELVTTTFEVDVNCPDCVKKIMNFIPMQRGIVDVSVDLPRHRATVTYDKRKSSNAAIVKHFAKIHIKAKVHVPAPPKKDPAPNKKR